jgi:hypothetical protein
LGERLLLEDSVSPLLKDNAREACELYRSWWQIAPVSLEAEARPEVRPRGEGTALFFTRGVDSWHSALRRTGVQPPERLSHLLYAPDLDRHFTPPTRRRALGLTREAASCLGVPLVPISHNGRALLDRFVDWVHSHGGVLAGIGLALGGWIANVVVASTHDSQHLVPWGSHPELDPLWSTERTTIRLDGVEVTRTEKVKAIAASPFAPSRLKVCWRADIDANCGRCEKCVRTQCALAIAGALDRAPVFLEPLSAQAVTALPAPEAEHSAPGYDPFWLELCENFPDDPALAGLRAAACARLPDWHPLSTAARKRDEPTVVIEAPPGAAVSLLPPSARSLLPAPVTSVEEHSATNSDVPRLEISWTTPSAGRIPLPLRPPAALGFDLLEACRRPVDRPVPWCLIAYNSLEAAQLMERLTASWGPGIACLSQKNGFDGDHGISHAEAARIQLSCETRVWWGGADYLDPFLVLAALTHGCLPLQCVREKARDVLSVRLSPGLAHFTLAIPDKGPVPPMSRQERATRLDGGLSVILAGSLERDLAMVTPSIRPQPS